MQEIVINKCYGGFGLSFLAIAQYLERKGKEAFFYGDEVDKNYKCTGLVRLSGAQLKNFHTVNVYTKDLGKKVEVDNIRACDKYLFSYYSIPRDDKDVVAVVKRLGEKAGGAYAELMVIEVPDGVKWVITDYDGIERVEEVHRSWG